MKKTVSVVIAVYNGEEYLAKAIESVLAQTFPAHEIIIIDDGSKDHTPNVIESYKKKEGVISKRVDPNAGVANAMNAGMAMATGEFIAFLDHDDVWFRTKLQKQVEALEKYPSAGFACCNYAVRPTGLGRRLVKHYSKMGSLKDVHLNEPFMQQPLKRMIRENFVGTSSAVLVRADVARRVGLFDASYRICGDFDFWLRCALITAYVVLPEVLFYKRTHATNISADLLPVLLEHRRILEELKAKRREIFIKNGWIGALDLELARVNYTLGNVQFERGNTASGFSFYRQGRQSCPNFSNTIVFLVKVTKKTTLRVLGKKK